MAPVRCLLGRSVDSGLSRVFCSVLLCSALLCTVVRVAQAWRCWRPDGGGRSDGASRVHTAEPAVSAERVSAERGRHHRALPSVLYE